VVTATALAAISLAAEPLAAASQLALRDNLAGEQKERIRRGHSDCCKKMFGKLKSVEINFDGRVFCCKMQ
jgi:hypothetical protein